MALLQRPHTVGGGLEVALACDIRLARKGNFQIGLPEVALGVLPGTGGTQRLSRIVGRAKAMEMMVEGTNLTMEQAQGVGLVHKVWETENHAAFMKKALDYAHGFTPPHKASMAVGRIKRAVHSGMEVSLEQGLALERELQAELFASQDAKEGLTAYTLKRKPVFKAR